MAPDGIAAWIIASLVLSLRIAPAFAFAPPFTLVRVPPLVRVLMGLGLASIMTSTGSAQVSVAHLDIAGLSIAAARELMIGSTFVLALQLCFAALYMAGRTLDIQAGFGLATLVDPTNQTQTPLTGTLFAYAAGAMFFATGGHFEVLRIMASSLDVIPLGAPHSPSLSHLLAFISVIFLASFGVAGGAILCLFLADVTIAFLSRTAPQLNVLVVGFQVKTILLFLVLPTAFGFAGSAILRMIRLTLEALPELL